MFNFFKKSEPEIFKPATEEERLAAVEVLRGIFENGHCSCNFGLEWMFYNDKHTIFCFYFPETRGVSLSYKGENIQFLTTIDKKELFKVVDDRILAFCSDKKIRSDTKIIRALNGK